MQDVVFQECCFETLFSQCVCLVEFNDRAGGNFHGSQATQSRTLGQNHLCVCTM